ncbi:FAD/NAD(P)-binding domain-containing protein [Mycena chlorophos]|uniref:FAD/NAD(P)-binding domain-containing protein n=1 Tax=Mycena chlorophos TaxID=658473 RepID=A0A8H6VTK9_MYCCL|nr:FAD/NAD(P)-binding domain-containing protein [Mycena chlorophos]
MESTAPRPLKVTIVGAGIGGLAAAAAMRKSGHIVELFESSTEKKEVGAGIGVQVNALRVLEHLGVDRANLRGVSYDGITNFDSITGEGRSQRWLLPDMDQNRSILCLRSDVHDELLRVACGEGPGTPATLYLGRKVVNCDPKKGSITLESGQVVLADLVIGADGIHSTIRARVLGHPEPAVPSGLSCFRALIPANKLEDLPESDSEWLTDGLSGLRGIVLKDRDFGMIGMYFCANKTLINLAALYQDAEPYDASAVWSSTTTRTQMLETFPTIHPKFKTILSLPDDPVLKWRLGTLPVLPTWINGRAMLMGDAAHATLPTLGQGAALAIEEAGALGILFPAGTRREDVESRLEMFERVRKPRGDFINREAIAQAAEKEKRGLYFRSQEAQAYFVTHDAIKEAQEYLERQCEIDDSKQCFSDAM